MHAGFGVDVEANVKGLWHFLWSAVRFSLKAHTLSGVAAACSLRMVTNQQSQVVKAFKVETKKSFIRFRGRRL
jgi:hypothetical protein